MNLRRLLWAGCTGFVDWGDGTTENYSGTTVTHEYASSGTYQISLNYGEGCPSPLKIAPITFTEIGERLLSVDTPLPKIFESVTNFSNLFASCYDLLSVPGRLLINCPNIDTMLRCFEECRSLPSIPNDLFRYTPLLENVYSCFSSCYGLTEIPLDLFDSNPGMTGFRFAFANCSNITGSVPPLWNQYPNADGYWCFYSCYRAENYNDIPDGWKGR